jgi:DNA mismatch repair protein MutL
MGRIHVLSENVANKIAAGEVVERPASVVKELLENSLDAGATRIKIQVEAGGKRLIQITDNGCGMVRDDALLAFERHATSKMKEAEDLLKISSLGFRGEALPAIASVCRLRLETRAAEEASGTVVEINGGKIFKVEEAGLPPGTSITIRDLFFNTPARKKFLKAESTELSHIASLFTQYALAHPDKHFELHSASHAILVAPPVEGHSQRVYQVFGKEILDSLIPVSAERALDRAGLPAPPPWRRPESGSVAGAASGGSQGEPSWGELRLHGLVSKPEIQKLNRNSIHLFVNGRLIRDRVLQHALLESYRNILPAAVFPVVLLFLDLPCEEVDVNVHPSKTEVRFRQSSAVHDFVRDTVRTALMVSRPIPQFATELHAHPTAAPWLGSGPHEGTISDPSSHAVSAASPEYRFRTSALPQSNRRFDFGGEEFRAQTALVERFAQTSSLDAPSADLCAGALAEEPATSMAAELELGLSLAAVKPLGQIHESFILGVNQEGLWIVDQHVAHERVLFEKVLKQRAAERVESQRLLLPLVLELTPAQQAVFLEIAEELNANGFEAEPFGSRSIAIKLSPAGIDPSQLEPMLQELLEGFSREEQELNLELVRSRIAASIACHAAIKVNMPLQQNKMEWLLAELAKTDYPISCPHGRPTILRYSMRDIQRAFKRI